MPKDSYGTRKFITNFKDKMKAKYPDWEVEETQPQDSGWIKTDATPGGRASGACAALGGTWFSSQGGCNNDSQCNGQCNSHCTGTCATWGEGQGYPNDSAYKCTACCSKHDSDCRWGWDCACQCNTNYCTYDDTHGSGYNYTCDDPSACNYDANGPGWDCTNGLGDGAWTTNWGDTGPSYTSYCNESGPCLSNDCDNECGGSATNDECGSCCGGDTQVACCNPSTSDCGGNCDCFGNILDCDGVCGTGYVNVTCYADTDGDGLGSGPGVAYCRTPGTCPANWVLNNDDAFPECPCSNNDASCFDECGECNGPGRQPCNTAGTSYCQTPANETYCGFPSSTAPTDCPTYDFCNECDGPGALSCNSFPNGPGGEDYCTDSGQTSCPGYESANCPTTDACGNCGAGYDHGTVNCHSSCEDCAGTCDGEAHLDDCGDCCDGASGHSCNGNMDQCGVCGGPGAPAFCDCDGNIIQETYEGNTVCACGSVGPGWAYTYDSCGSCLYDSPNNSSGRLDEGDNFFPTMTGPQGPYEYPCACPNSGLYPSNEGNMAWFDYCGVCGASSTPFSGNLMNNCAQMACRDTMAWNCCPAMGLLPVPYNTDNYPHFGVVSCSDCTDCSTWEAAGKGMGQTLTPATECLATDEVTFPGGVQAPFWMGTCRYAVQCPDPEASNYSESICSTFPWYTPGAWCEQGDEDPYGDGCQY